MALVLSLSIVVPLELVRWYQFPNNRLLPLVSLTLSFTYTVCNLLRHFMEFVITVIGNVSNSKECEWQLIIVKVVYNVGRHEFDVSRPEANMTLTLDPDIWCYRICFKFILLLIENCIRFNIAYCIYGWHWLWRSDRPTCLEVGMWCIVEDNALTLFCYLNANMK